MTSPPDGVDAVLAVYAELLRGDCSGLSAARVARLTGAELRGPLASALEPARSELVCRGAVEASHAWDASAATASADPFAASP